MAGLVEVLHDAEREGQHETDEQDHAADDADDNRLHRKREAEDDEPEDEDEDGGPRRGLGTMALGHDGASWDPDVRRRGYRPRASPRSRAQRRIVSIRSCSCAAVACALGGPPHVARSSAWTLPWGTSVRWCHALTRPLSSLRSSCRTL